MHRRQIVFLIFLTVLFLNACSAKAPRPAAELDTVPVKINMATFDSGFGGYFTAKSMESLATPILKQYDTEITITHYGDTQNAPYGEKTPAQIARLTQRGVEKAFENQADLVMIACNTASTQHEAVVKGIKKSFPQKAKYVLSIIKPTVAEVKKFINQELARDGEAILAVFATPATIQSRVYPTRLAEAYGAGLTSGQILELEQKKWQKPEEMVTNLFLKSKIDLPEDKVIHIYQFAPVNWVSMIEQGAPVNIKQSVVSENVRQLLKHVPPRHAIDVFGFFCTHFPVFEDRIEEVVTKNGYAKDSTRYVAQGELAARYAYEVYAPNYVHAGRTTRLTPEQLERLVQKTEPTFVMSGDNTEQTRKLIKTVFPNSRNIKVIQENF